MSSTYDPTLPTNKDWVRLLIGDRNVPNSVFQDEEILAVLIEFPNKYCAAAQLLDANRSILLTTTGGATSKTVGNLSISFGSATQSAESALTDLIDRLRAQCLQAGAAGESAASGFFHVYIGRDC